MNRWHERSKKNCTGKRDDYARTWRRHLLRKESSTSIRPLTLAIGAGVGTSTNTGVVITVPDMNSQVTYLQNTSDMTAGTDVVNLRGFVVILVCGS